MDYKKIYNKEYFAGKNSFFYGLGYGNFAKYSFDNKFKQIEKYVNIIKQGNVLDVGCAYGYMLQRFPDTFKKYGIDVSTYAITKAKERLPQAVLKVAEAESELPFRDNFFDIILCNDLIEHLKTPELALTNIVKLLKKNGIFYITTPNLNSFRKIMFRYADKQEHHISLFAHNDLKQLLHSLDIKIIEHWTFVSFFFYQRFKSNIGTESAFIC